MNVSNSNGGYWGWDVDGRFSNKLPELLAVPVTGGEKSLKHSNQLLYPITAPAPKITINAKGGRYYFHSAKNGHLLQLEAEGIVGSQDIIDLSYEDEQLAGFRFTPQSTTNNVVPRIGLEVGKGESAVFQWLGLNAPGGGSVGFSADKTAKSVNYHNDSTQNTLHLLSLNSASGPADHRQHMVYGPFDTTSNANHQIVLENWPNTTHVRSEWDYDGDGVFEISGLITGRQMDPVTDVTTTVNLSITARAVPQTVLLGEKIKYSFVVANSGPGTATSIHLFDNISNSTDLLSVSSSQGKCVIDDKGFQCALDYLRSGEEATISFVMLAKAMDDIDNALYVTSLQREENAMNNYSITKTQVLPEL